MKIFFKSGDISINFQIVVTLMSKPILQLFYVFIILFVYKQNFTAH